MFQITYLHFHNGNLFFDLILHHRTFFKMTVAVLWIKMRSTPTKIFHLYLSLCYCFGKLHVIFVKWGIRDALLYKIYTTLLMLNDIEIICLGRLLDHQLGYVFAFWCSLLSQNYVFNHGKKRFIHCVEYCWNSTHP